MIPGRALERWGPRPWHAWSNPVSRPRCKTLVIGCGNLLGADDGVGLAVLERMRRMDLPPEVELVDGGTWGLNLLPDIERADRLLLLDAVAAGERPGTPIVLFRESIPRFLATKLSPHQIDLREVLALAEFRGTLPEETVVIGVQPERVEMSTRLSPVVAARVEELAEMALRQLEIWQGRADHPAPPPELACTS